MSARPVLTDAELVARLQLKEKHKTIAKAAAAYGIGSRAFAESLAVARARGLTAATKLKSAEERLRTELALAKQELAQRNRDELSAEIIRTTIYGLAAMTPEPPKWISDKRKPKSSGVPVTVWSDWHYGETVFPSEVGGQNRYNRAIAKQRVRRLVETTIDLAKRHMVKPQYPGIVVCLAGDMISGDIHEELAETNDGPVQQSLLEVQELLEWGLRRMADEFGRVFVPCVVGNHGRMTRKPRAKHRVFTSYEWNLYCQLERTFRHDKRIQFHIPNEADAFFTVNGHRFALTHGDALGVKGGDGIIGAIGPITRGAIKFGRQQRQMKRDIDTLIIGHWHQYIPRGANGILVNNALKGFDEYANLYLRAPPTAPSQTLAFVHPKYGITAQWEILLEDKAKKPQKSEWVTWQDMRRAA